MFDSLTQYFPLIKIIQSFFPLISIFLSSNFIVSSSSMFFCHNFCFFELFYWFECRSVYIIYDINKPDYLSTTRVLFRTCSQRINTTSNHEFRYSRASIVSTTARYAAQRKLKSKTTLHISNESMW